MLFPVKGSDLARSTPRPTSSATASTASASPSPTCSARATRSSSTCPGVKDRAKAEDLVGETAELRFRRCQAQLPWATPIADDHRRRSRARRRPPSRARPPRRAPPAVDGDHVDDDLGLGRPARDDPDRADRGARARRTDDDRPDRDTAPTTVAGAAPTTAPGATTPTTVAPPQPGQSCTELRHAEQGERRPTPTVWLPGRPVDDGDRPSCFVLGPAIVTGKSIGTAERVYDSNTASWVTDITLQEQRLRREDRAARTSTSRSRSSSTASCSRRRRSTRASPAATCRSPAVHQGEAKDLALVLRYGALPVQFDQDEQTVESVSPTLGKDQLHAGIVAGLIGLALVALYMLALLPVARARGVRRPRAHRACCSSRSSRTCRRTQGLDAHARGRDRHHRVGRCHRRLVRRVLRTTQGRGAHAARPCGRRSTPASGAPFRTIVAADLVSLLGAAVLYCFATGSVRGFAFFLGLSTLIDLVLA